MTDAQIEAAARAIAASKRGSSPGTPEIDAVWRSYMGQAKAAISAYLSHAPAQPEFPEWTTALANLDALRRAWEATAEQHDAAHEAQDAYVAALVETAPALITIAVAAQTKEQDNG